MKLATATASTMLAAWNALYASGTLVVTGGTEPTTPETAESGDTILFTMTFSSTAFGTPGYTSPNELATAAFTSSTVSPTNSGTASFARAFASNGTTVLADYTVGASGSGADIIIGSTTITVGTNDTVSSFVHEIPAY